MMVQQEVSTSREPVSTSVGAAKIYEEGIVAGLIGAATIAIWFLILDVIQGRPLYTPTVLGTALFRGGAKLSSPESLASSFELVLWFTWVHVLVFMVIGGAAAGLLRLAERDPNFGFGILLCLAVSLARTVRGFPPPLTFPYKRGRSYSG